MAKQTTTTTAAAAAPAPTVATLAIVGKPAKAYRGARAAWWVAIQAYNGKPVAAFCANCLANPPSTPQRGKLRGKCEPPQGWVQYFVRQGLVVVKT